MDCVYIMSPTGWEPSTDYLIVSHIDTLTVLPLGLHTGPDSHPFKVTLGECIVPDNPADASCLCARVKGRGMSI